MKAKYEMTKSTRKTTNARKSNETPTIVLKTIHNDIMRDNKNSTLTTKMMRAKLRTTMREIHVHNSSWIFTQSQYDDVRAMFDDAYRAKIERARKRATPAKSRNAKSTNDAPVAEPVA